MASSWFDSNAPAGMADPNPPYIPYEEGGFTGGRTPGAGASGNVSIDPATGQPVGPATAEQTTGAAPSAGASSPPPGGYTESWFTQTFGTPKTPQELVALEAQLAKYGIKVRRNASGVAGDIELPGGQVVDVIGNAMGGGGNFQWIPDAPGGPGGTGAPGSYAGTFTGGGQYPLASVMGTGLMQPWTTPFQAPNDVTQQNDPGWAFRMKEGTKAIERSAAARGTLLTGGAIKDLNAWAQDFASNEYDKVYGRAKGEYDTAYNIFNNNQANQFGRLYNVSNQGLQAAGGTANTASSYGANSANNATGGANAAAAGTVAANNASTTGWTNAINTGLDYLGTWANRPPANDTGGVATTGPINGNDPNWQYVNGSWTYVGNAN